MAADANTIKVAIADSFLDALVKLPKKKQAKVIDFVSKFKTNPKGTGIHYEKINHAVDDALRSVRIDKEYRGIALAPKSGKVFVMLWVDHHDGAYRWAENKVVQIHPETGSLQILSVREGEQPQAPAPTRAKGLFDQFKDKQLGALGIPDILYPVVRSMKTEDDLDHLADHFPQEAAEALYMLAAGFSLQEVMLELDKPEEPPQVDTEDFAAALANPDSQRRFYVVEDEHELEQVLSAPLEKWRVFLHPSQRKLVENTWNGPVRVLGGAGTGKTVVAMHRARHLAAKVFTKPADRVLVTTFTRNLAEDIRGNLKNICPDEVMDRIEVTNLDKWVGNFLRKQGYDYRVDYGSRKLEDCWQSALTMAPPELNKPESFYREEWELVIQPQGIESLDAYKKASRIGRGVRLSRKAREAVWQVFEEYRLALTDAGIREGQDAIADARAILEANPPSLPYRAIVVDEAQDMGEQAFKLIRALLPKDAERPQIFVVGDAHQRIYRHKVVLSRCDINIRGRGRRLKLNYRTTDETRRWAVALLKDVTIDDLDGDEDTQKGYRSLMHGEPPRVELYDDFESEVEAIAEYLETVQEQDGTLAATCLVTRTNKLLDEYQSALQARGFEVCRVRRTQPDDRRAKGLRLATMHRVKGLEFERVVLSSINKGVVPLDDAIKSAGDPAVRKSLETTERSLLYVAATRAQLDVLVTGYVRLSVFVDSTDQESRQ